MGGGEQKKIILPHKITYDFLVNFKHKRQESQTYDRMDFAWGVGATSLDIFADGMSLHPIWESFTVILSRGSKPFSECCQDSLRMHKQRRR